MYIYNEVHFWYKWYKYQVFKGPSFILQNKRMKGDETLTHLILFEHPITYLCHPLKRLSSRKCLKIFVVYFLMNIRKKKKKKLWIYNYQILYTRFFKETNSTFSTQGFLKIYPVDVSKFPDFHNFGSYIWWLFIPNINGNLHTRFFFIRKLGFDLLIKTFLRKPWFYK